VTEPSRAVFLSYASQDAQAAQRICAALRAGGVEVFLDQSELRGGDVWDQKIRREINACALFIPVISSNTASRYEGYFRLEWDLADQRSHMFSRSRVFVVPVCLDEITEALADVPESFKRVQWTRLPGGETPAAFVEHVRRLLSPEPATTRRPPAGTLAAGAAASGAAVPSATRAGPIVLAGVAVLALVAVAYLLLDKYWMAKHMMAAAPATGTQQASAGGAALPAFAPPPHSIAVLPFVNMSGDKDQEYFSDGLTEELLNSLARINQLQVAARTSAFSFKGKDTDIGTIARKLNVAAVLEGSVRRSAHTVRITAQLINAVTGFHLWSQTYDRDLGDVLELQTNIANAVASALKVTLLGDAASRIEVGGTHIPAAFDAYLRAAKTYGMAHDARDYQAAISGYTEAIRLDPQYALAFAARSYAFTTLAADFATGAAIRENYMKAQADAHEALTLAPDVAEGHLALANLLETGSLDLTHAREEYERAIALAPGDAHVLETYGRNVVSMGRVDEAIAAARRGVVLDPLNRRSHRGLGLTLFFAHRYAAAIAAFQDALALDPDDPGSLAYRGLSFYALGNLQGARASCQVKSDYVYSEVCLAITDEKLARHAEAQAQLEKLRSSMGDATAYQYAEIYAQWGNTSAALDWLEKALRVGDPGLADLETDPLLEALHKEPRFLAIARVLKLPS
jgi:TolB-like protein/Flp pilus assembly protein TadD